MPPRPFFARLSTRLSVALVVLAAGLTALLDAGPARASTFSYSNTYGYSGPAGIYPYGSDWDPKDNTLLVGDYWNKRIKRFAADGTSFTTLVSGAVAKGAPGGYCLPYDIAADPGGSSTGAFWVADQDCGRAVQYDHNGSFLRTIGPGGTPPSGTVYSNGGCGGGKMKIPTHLVVDQTTRVIYMSDPRCGNVYAFNADTGAFRSDISFDWASAVGSKVPVPRGIDQDAAGNVYVADQATFAVYVFSKTGAYLGVKAQAAQPSNMQDPRGLSIDKNNGFVYVVGAAYDMVVKFKITAGSPPAVAWEQTFGATDGTVSGTNGGTRFNTARWPAADNAGHLWVTDTWGFTIWRFDASSKPAVSQPFGAGILPAGPPNGGYNLEYGIAVSNADSSSTLGHLFVVDYYDNRAQGFNVGPGKTCTGKNACSAFDLAFGQRVPAGPNNEGFGYPRSISYDPRTDDATDPGNAHVWVGDTNKAVSEWTLGGTFIRKFGSLGGAAGQFKGSIDGLRVSGTKIFTTDSANCRLQVFDTTTNPPNLISHSNAGCKPATSGFMNGPRGIAVDGTTAYVLEGMNNIVSVWNTSGQFASEASTFSPNCAGTGLSGGFGLAFDNTKTWLYAADTGHNRVVRFTPNGATCEVVMTGSSMPSGTPSTMKLTGPRYVEFGPDSRLFVSDASRHVFAFAISS
jgi:sugar lactone lactonase YvrE